MSAIAALVIAASLFSATSARATILDSFQFTTYPGVTLTTASMSSFSESGIAGVVGGDRTIDATATAATSLVNSVAFEIFDGQANYGSGPTADGEVALTYDGATLAADLGGILADISVNFLAFDAAFGQGLAVTVSLFDGVDTAMQTESLTTSSAIPVALVFDVSQFTNIGAVDLANLTSIRVELDAARAQDFELTDITFRLVPEPSAFALLAIGGVVLLGVIRCAGRRSR